MRSSYIFLGEAHVDTEEINVYCIVPTSNSKQQQRSRTIPMASEKYLITGLAKETGVHPRKDITEFMDPESKQWNLFLQALRTFHDQTEGDDNPLGYYQIAGIHGAPFINWMEAHEDGDRPMDYCTHGTQVLPLHLDRRGY